MNQSKMQGTYPQITSNPITPPIGQSAPDPTKGANQAAANLSFVNTMQDHLMKYKSPKAPETPQNAPQEEQKLETTKEPDINKELTDFKTEIEGLLESKLGDLKREIEVALKEEDAKENQTN